MQFIYPLFLWALAAIAIPIIIHLFYFRRFRRVYFTNVRFLREVKEERSRRSRLRNLLVLLMRVLAVIFLVLAFAQPFIPQESEVRVGRKAVSIYVDNSHSMGALGEDVPLLEQAKRRAREIVDAYGVEDRFQVLTNEFRGRNQRLVGKEEALALIDEVEPSYAVRYLSSVMERQRQALATESINNDFLYLISDFQRSSSDLNQLRADTVENTTLVPLRAVQRQNVAIDSVWFEAPVPQFDQNNALLVRLRNYSDQEGDNVRLSLRYRNQTKPEGEFQVPPGGEIIDTVYINVPEPGLQEATLSITDYPIQFDDQYYITFRVAAQVRVLVLEEQEPNRFLNAALNGLQVFAPNYLGVRQIDYSTLPDYQLIIIHDLPQISSGLANELQRYVRQGGNLLVFPPIGVDLPSYQSFLQGFPANELVEYQEGPLSVGSLNTEEFIFGDVFENQNEALRLPTVQATYRLNNFSNRREEALMQYRNGQTALAKFNIDRGNLYLSAAPLSADVNDLVQNGEIFIPMLYKMGISAGNRQKLAYTIGTDERITADHRATSSDLVYKLQGPNEEFIPEQRVVGSEVFLSLNNQVIDAGFYELFLRPDSIQAEFAFNFDRTESQLDYYTANELRDSLAAPFAIINSLTNAPLTNQIATSSQGVQLWWWCLVLALLFLAIEVLLLRFFKGA